MSDPSDESFWLPADIKEPDFASWARLSYWTKREASALLMGASPDDLYNYGLNPLTKVDLNDPRGAAFAERYLENEILVERRFGKEFGEDRVPPAVLIEWARGINIDVPDELTAAVTQFHPPSVDWRSKIKALEAERARLGERVAALEAELVARNANPSVQTRERESLLKLVIGMAIGGYGYDPTATRSTVPKEIADDLLTRGISLSDDTVRRYLKEATDAVLPPETE